MRVAAFVIAALAFALLPVNARGDEPPVPAASGAHAFGFTSIEGEALPLESFAGKAVLVVNTASRCGFTRQYGDLQALWERFRDRGLVVLGVPSNDFGGQEPGSEAEIKEFCEVNFGITFPLMEKTRVRGPDAHPFYAWIEQTQGIRAAPQWNFHKYLIGPDGQVLAWFPSRVTPTSADVRGAVEAALEGPVAASGPAAGGG